MWKVYFFQTSRKHYPVKEFIENQSFSVQARINKSIRLLVNHGPFLKPPYIKKLDHNLYELRIKTQIAIRIFYSPKNNCYYLLHAFKKKSQKTPSRELKVALDRIKQLI